MQSVSTPALLPKIVTCSLVPLSGGSTPLVTVFSPPDNAAPKHASVVATPYHAGRSLRTEGRNETTNAKRRYWAPHLHNAGWCVCREAALILKQKESNNPKHAAAAGGQQRFVSSYCVLCDCGRFSQSMVRVSSGAGLLKQQRKNAPVLLSILTLLLLSSSKTRSLSPYDHPAITNFVG